MSGHGILQGKWTSGSGKDTIETFLPIYSFVEDGINYAICPPLDITGYGNSEPEAKGSLGIMIGEFFDYTIKKRTFLSELTRLGWTVKKKKKLIAPAIEEIARKDPNFADILNNKNYTVEQSPINMPIAV